MEKEKSKKKCIKGEVGRTRGRGVKGKKENGKREKKRRKKKRKEI